MMIKEEYIQEVRKILKLNDNGKITDKVTITKLMNLDILYHAEEYERTK